MTLTMPCDEGNVLVGNCANLNLNVAKWCRNGACFYITNIGQGVKTRSRDKPRLDGDSPLW